MIRIGIVGCGRILAAHLRAYRLLSQLGFDDFRITALCSRRREDAASYVRRGSGPAQRKPVSELPGDPLAIGDEYLSDFQATDDVQLFTDYREMIAEGPVDAINDFSTHSLHHRVASAAFAAGKDLLTQKPLAVSIAHARDMCRQAEQGERVFGVFENARFRPATRWLRWLFNGGPGGRLQLVLSGSIGRWWAPDRIVAETPWRHRRVEGGGITLDIGVHQFNLIRAIAGEIVDVRGQVSIVEPRRVTIDAEGRVRETVECDADDTCLATFQTERQVQGTLLASWAGHGGATLLGPGQVWYGSGGRAAGAEFAQDDGTTADLARLYRQHAPAELQSRDFPIETDNEFVLAQHDWLQAIRERRPPETDGLDGLKDLACAFAVLESSLAGRCIRVDDVINGRVADFQRPLNDHLAAAGETV